METNARKNTYGFGASFTQKPWGEEKNYNFREFFEDWCLFHANFNLKEAFHVIIIDDNMFYRSMRHEYYQLARKVSFSYSQIYFHCPVEVALMRNEKRSSPVKEETVFRIFNNFEKPTPKKLAWEKYSLFIDTTNIEFEDKWEDVFELLHNAAINKPSPLKELNDIEKAREQNVTARSFVHQTDQILRKYISQMLQTLKAKNACADVLKNTAKSFNQLRKTIIDNARNETEKNMQQILQYGSSSSQSLTMKESMLEQHDIRIPFNENSLLSTFHVDSNHKTFVMDYFWDLITLEEFGDVVRAKFDCMLKECCGKEGN